MCVSEDFLRFAIEVARNKIKMLFACVFVGNSLKIVSRSDQTCIQMLSFLCSFYELVLNRLSKWPKMISNAASVIGASVFKKKFSKQRC